MINREGIAGLRGRLTEIRNASGHFFDQALERQNQYGTNSDIWDSLLTPELRNTGEGLRTDIRGLSVDIAGAARGSPLIAEVDLQDLRHNGSSTATPTHAVQARRPPPNDPRMGRAGAGGHAQRGVAAWAAASSPRGRGRWAARRCTIIAWTWEDTPRCSDGT